MVCIKNSGNLLTVAVAVYTAADVLWRVGLTRTLCRWRMTGINFDCARGAAAHSAVDIVDAVMVLLLRNWTACSFRDGGGTATSTSRGGEFVE